MPGQAVWRRGARQWNPTLSATMPGGSTRRGAWPALLLLALQACARVNIATGQQQQTAEDLFTAADALYRAQKYAEALPLCNKAAIKFQHAGSQFQVGRFYSDGYGVAKDRAEGVRWFS